MAKIKRGEHEYYIDSKLAKNLDKIAQRVNNKDEDFFWAIDGGEGVGKSVFAMSIAKYVDESFNLSRICYSPEDFRRAIQTAKKGEAIVFDEAFRGLSSRSAISGINKMLVETMMECRQRNLFVFIVLPSFFLLDKYVALWRARGLFHVYRNGGQRGFWRYYNSKKKKLLYLNGRQTYSYTTPKTSFKGRFTNYYVVDEQAYRRKKLKALQENEQNPKLVDKSQLHRDTLLLYLHEHHKMSMSDLAGLCEQFRIPLKRSSVAAAIRRARQTLEKGSETATGA